MFAALLFAAHPAMTETISCSTMRDDALALLFIGLSYLSYAKFRTSGNKKWSGISLILFLLSLLSKLMAATFPLILWFLEYIKGAGSGSHNSRNRIRKATVLMIPFLIVVIGFLLLRILYFHPAQETYESTSLSLRFLLILSSGKALVYYIWLMILPIHQSIDPAFNLAESAGDVMAWAALIAGFLSFVICIIIRNRAPDVSFLWISILLALVPVLNKCDLPRKASAEAVAKATGQEPVIVSAARGDGLGELECRIVDTRYPERPAQGAPAVFTERQERCLRAALEAAGAGDTAGAARCLNRALDA